MKRAHKTLITSMVVLGVVALGTAVIGKPAPRRPAADPPAECTANIENGKKYHWVTYQGGSPHQSGYVVFTDKTRGRWSKVVHATDQPKAKHSFWGYHNATRLSFKRKGGERWTAWMKYCEGPKINGNVYQDGKVVRQFTLDTSRVR